MKKDYYVINAKNGNTFYVIKLQQNNINIIKQTRMNLYVKSVITVESAIKL